MGELALAQHQEEHLEGEQHSKTWPLIAAQSSQQTSEHTLPLLLPLLLPSHLWVLYSRPPPTPVWSSQQTAHVMLALSTTQHTLLLPLLLPVLPAAQHQQGALLLHEAPHDQAAEGAAEGLRVRDPMFGPCWLHALLASSCILCGLLVCQHTPCVISHVWGAFRACAVVAWLCLMGVCAQSVVPSTSRQSTLIV